MITKKFLDQEGLSYFWEKVKQYIDDSQTVIPIASSSQLGGVKIGNNLTVDSNGVVNITIASTHSPSGTTAVNGAAVESALATSGININDDGNENITIQSIKGQTNIVTGD